MGCTQDSLEANMWYWRAAQQGEERAKRRMQIIQASVSGASTADLGAQQHMKNKKSFFSGLGLKK